MGASLSDISLTIVRGGLKAHYAGVKGCGALIWDIRTGVFDPGALHGDPHHALDWLSESDWDDSVELLSAPLTDPTYGYVTIDFDNKVVVDENGYGNSDSMYFDWFYRSLESAAEGSDGFIPGVSLREHLKHGRILITERPVPTADGLVKLQARTVKAVLKDCQAMVGLARSTGETGPTWAVLAPAEGWIFRSIQRQEGCEAP